MNDVFDVDFLPTKRGRKFDKKGFVIRINDIPGNLKEFKMASGFRLKPGKELALMHYDYVFYFPSRKDFVAPVDFFIREGIGKRLIFTFKQYNQKFGSDEKVPEEQEKVTVHVDDSCEKLSVVSDVLEKANLTMEETGEGMKKFAGAVEKVPKEDDDVSSGGRGDD